MLPQQRNVDPPGHRLISSLELNYSRLRSCTANLFVQYRHDIRTVLALLVLSSMDEAQLLTAPLSPRCVT